MIPILPESLALSDLFRGPMAAGRRPDSGADVPTGTLPEAQPEASDFSGLLAAVDPGVGAGKSPDLRDIGKHLRDDRPVDVELVRTFLSNPSSAPERRSTGSLDTGTVLPEAGNTLPLTELASQLRIERARGQVAEPLPPPEPHLAAPVDEAQRTASESEVSTLAIARAIPRPLPEPDKAAIIAEPTQTALPLESRPDTARPSRAAMAKPDGLAGLERDHSATPASGPASASASAHSAPEARPPDIAPTRHVSAQQATVTPEDAARGPALSLAVAAPHAPAPSAPASNASVPSAAAPAPETPAPIATTPEQPTAISALVSEAPAALRPVPEPLMQRVVRSDSRGDSRGETSRETPPVRTTSAPAQPAAAPQSLPIETAFDAESGTNGNANANARTDPGRAEMPAEAKQASASPLTPQTSPISAPAAPVTSLQTPLAPQPQVIADNTAALRASAQIESTIEHLATAREAGRAASGDLTLRHQEFGAVTMRLELAGGDLRAVLAARDPGFVPAIQAALAERAVTAGQEAAAAQGNGRGNDQSSSQQGSQSNSQSGSQSGSQGWNGAASSQSDPRYGSSPGSGQASPQPYSDQTGPSDEDAAGRKGTALSGEDLPAPRDSGLYA